jgi:hypothetical protein
VIPCTSRRSLAAQEAFPAKHRAPLCWLEWDRSFAAALRTLGKGFGLLVATPSTLPLRFASLAPFRLILEILIVEEVLLPRCENELCSAIRALEYTILEIRH